MWAVATAQGSDPLICLRLRRLYVGGSAGQLHCALCIAASPTLFSFALLSHHGQ
ncbi:hypothetical protein M440DRAFT_1403278 [Trichoderma longibrachiatum ATCC 18648]|uniref:Uncharacterized protein n=1 Tax=Trichoderma longibrachiatum ATCC 18648 TaxID=983965 RepID=A0A2T4BZM5_TRILO|nr:hypothetical protein M440DRAFT_1403278 [Trichoderma longibrachiatum ATCC 18648]